MVNGNNPCPVFELPRHARSGIAVLDAQLAPRAVAIGVDRRLRHAEFTGDLFGRKVLVDQPQAFALARREKPHQIIGDDVARSHARQ